jgi:hypothetical protein
MTMPNRNVTLLSLFERIGGLYVGRFMNPTWDGAAPNRDPSARQALQLFAGSYAYEYLGAPANFGPAAVAAIRSSRTLDPSATWSAFCSQVAGGTNPQHNLLYHETSSCICVLCRLRDRGHLTNLVTRARDRLQSDQVAFGHQELKSIRGIGPKLASFFLRDVAIRYDVSPVSDRYLLQPVDLWIRRFVRRLACDEELGDYSIARWVVDHSSRPEWLNAGMWYFGAQIASQQFVYDAALASPHRACELAEQHVARLAGAVRFWNAGR